MFQKLLKKLKERERKKKLLLKLKKLQREKHRKLNSLKGSS